MSAPRKLSGRASQVSFEALSIEGGLLSPEWLARLAQLGATQQSESDYRVPKGLNLRDEIGRSWRIAQAHWRDFDVGRSRGADAVDLSERFVPALLGEVFGFTSLAPSEPVEREGRVFPIGRLALGGHVPVVVAPAGIGLDTASSRFGEGGRKRSAFGLGQEFLNAADEALWGLVCDGVTLRLLRDNASLTRPAWVEADLARIFQEERYADFAALWLLVHETRFGRADQPPTECPLEAWRSAGREEGTRARANLRRGVEAALLALGQGFLAHPENAVLRAALDGGALDTHAYFQELLRLVYRLIFLLTAEERGVLHAPGSSEAARRLYEEGFGLRRLRERALRHAAHDHYGDLWAGLSIVVRAMEHGEPRLGLPALGGLFGAAQCPSLDASRLTNQALLGAMFHLAWMVEGGALVRVNWRDMGPEELGSVYESLLELMPHVALGGRQFAFASRDGNGGNARRASGSYYTPHALVRVLLDRALEPVVAEAIAAHPADPVEAVLALTVVDPACGSGHFLLAAARRLAAHVARLSTSGTPSAAEYRHALRQVVGRCIYGVDLNPMALELCRVSLWMEAVEPGLALSFLDSHLQVGNALLGATPELMAKGIPDTAWEPVEGDDRKVASALKKRNKSEAKGQQGFEALWSKPTVGETDTVATAVEALEKSSDADLEAVRRKATEWNAIRASEAFRHQRFVADAWCAAFVWPKEPGALVEAAPTNALWRQLRDGHGRAPARTAETVQEVAGQYRFFHWHLAFPQVFRRGGFDAVLGNPPWIAHAGRAAQPIPGGVKAFHQHAFEAFADYPTTHGMFVEQATRILRRNGQLGLIIPSSLSELDGYRPTRHAHDARCAFVGELVDFGEGQFPGVTQPCMALVSRRVEGGRSDAPPGDPWPMERPDLDAVARRLVARLVALPCLPEQLFGERGLQSDRSLAPHFRETSEPVDRFTTPIREGTDVREFQLLAPRFHVDRTALAGRLRTAVEFQAVRVVVRQTARFPIAARSDGGAFRNSLLAVFETEDWPAAVLVALLNSSVLRWLHYVRFRDARQPVMPQLKIGHLRAIPAPVAWTADARARLAALGERLSQQNRGIAVADREALNDLVADMYQLDPGEREMVERWHGPFAARATVETPAANDVSPALEGVL